MKSIRISPVLALLLIIFFIRSGWCILPERSYPQFPWQYHIQYDSLNIKTTDGIRLTGWLCRPNRMQNDDIIILASADAGNMCYQLPVVQWLVSTLGVRVLMFDYRGFGTSDLITIDTDLIALPGFAADLHSVVRWTADSLQHDTSKIILYGRSMGAALALTVASVYKGVGGVIAESPYASQASISIEIGKLYTAQHITRKIRQIDSDLLEPLNVIDKCDCKVLLIAGQHEDTVPADDFFRLYSKCGAKEKSVWIAPNARHLEAPFKQTSLFVTIIQSFLMMVD